MRLRACASWPARALLAASAAETAYLLVLLAAGRGLDAPPDVGADDLPELIVLVPAHDEELHIEGTVASLLAAAYPASRREVVVIADNCTDATARLAGAAGATVWERVAPDDRGKGQALAWAIARVRAERPQAQGIVVVDADCRVSANLLTALGSALARGADAAQAEYRVANAEASATAALRFAGFALFNRVRPRGKERLGLSVGLLGTGMAFPLRTLDAVPWEAFSVTEDREYHLRMVASGRRVRFAPHATVLTDAPVGEAAAAVQQTRWETGNVELALRWAPPLLRAGLAVRDRQRLHTGLELLVPPLSLIVTPVAACLVAAPVLRDRALGRAAVTVAGAQGAYVMGGLASSRAPGAVYAALARAPLLIARKLGQYLRIAGGGGATDWERTQRAE